MVLIKSLMTREQHFIGPQCESCCQVHTVVVNKKLTFRLQNSTVARCKRFRFGGVFPALLEYANSHGIRSNDTLCVLHSVARIVFPVTRGMLSTVTGLSTMVCSAYQKQ